MAIDTYDLPEVFEAVFKLGKEAGEELNEAKRQAETDQNNQRMLTVALQGDMVARNERISYLEHQLNIYKIKFGVLLEETPDADMAMQAIPLSDLPF